MAYKVIILYRLYMPSYVLGTFTEYPFLFFLYKDQETSYRFFAIIHRLFSKGKAALFFFFCFLQLNLRSGLISTMTPARPFLYFFELHIFQ